MLSSTAVYASDSNDKLNFFERVYINYKYDSTVNNLNNSNQVSSASADISQFSVPVSSEGIIGIKADDPNAVSLSVQAEHNKIIITDSSDYKYLFSVAIPYETIKPMTQDGVVKMTHISDDGVITTWNQ